jgi:hypothetical protein
VNARDARWLVAIRPSFRAKHCGSRLHMSMTALDSMHPAPAPAATEAPSVRRVLLPCNWPVLPWPRTHTADTRSSVTMARPSITGFDPKKFAAASANGTKGDPWAR